MPLDRTVQPNGQKIKALRKDLKWSQEDLAREALCGKRTVENAEAGKRVKESGLTDIAARLGVAVSELICDDRSPTGPGAVLDGHWHIVTSFEEIGEEEFDVEITSRGQSVSGQATCIKGRDKGHLYLMEGTFANLILRATWSCADPTRIEAGTVCLRLLENGNVLDGFNTYYHTIKGVLCVTPQTYRRATVQKRSRTKRYT